MADEQLKAITQQVDSKHLRDVGSMLELDPESMDSTKNYRFVREDPMRIARHRMKGYKLSSKADGPTCFAESDDRGDDVIRVGDTVLMECPKEQYEERQKAKRDLATNRLSGPKKKVEDLADRVGKNLGTKVQLITNKE